MRFQVERLSLDAAIAIDLYACVYRFAHGSCAQLRAVVCACSMLRRASSKLGDVSGTYCFLFVVHRALGHKRRSVRGDYTHVHLI